MEFCGGRQFTFLNAAIHRDSLTRTSKSFTGTASFTVRACAAGNYVSGAGVRSRLKDDVCEPSALRAGSSWWFFEGLASNLTSSQALKIWLLDKLLLLEKKIKLLVSGPRYRWCGLIDRLRVVQIYVRKPVALVSTITFAAYIRRVYLGWSPED